MTWWTLAIPCSNSPLHSGGKQHSPGACLTAALHSQLVGSPYLCGVDLLYDLKDSFMFWDFLPHVSCIVMPSPFYSPNEQLQSKGGVGAQCCMCREGWGNDGEQVVWGGKIRQTVELARPSPGRRDRLWRRSLGAGLRPEAEGKQRRNLPMPSFCS